MKKDSLNTINSTIALILVVVAFYLAQWAITAGLLWVIFKIFHIPYTLKLATGIWLILILLQNYFKSSNDK